jgi:hypothetical protein
MIKTLGKTEIELQIWETKKSNKIRPTGFTANSFIPGNLYSNPLVVQTSGH